MKSSLLLFVVTLAACASGPRTDEPRLSAIGEGVWHVRLELDSAPAHTSSVQRVEGAIDFQRSTHTIDFRPLVGHGFESGVAVEAVKHIDERRGGFVTVSIVLGDSLSDHAKVVLSGQLSRGDTVFGTWSELHYCCMAGGRFALWRGGH